MWADTTGSGGYTALTMATRVMRRGAAVSFQLKPSLLVMQMDFAEDVSHGAGDLPARVVLLEFRDVADPPDMIAAAIRLDVRRAQLLAGDVLAQMNRLDQRT